MRLSGLLQKTVLRAPSGIFLHEKGCYPESFGLLRLCRKHRGVGKNTTPRVLKSCTTVGIRVSQIRKKRTQQTQADTMPVNYYSKYGKH